MFGQWNWLIKRPRGTGARQYCPQEIEIDKTFLFCCFFDETNEWNEFFRLHRYHLCIGILNLIPSFNFMGTYLNT